MSARRRDLRLEVVNADGVLRVLRDVVLRRIGEGEYLAISHEAGVRGEVLTVYFPSEGNTPVPVRVAESRPTIVGGSVRHQLRLTSLDHQAGRRDAKQRRGCSEAE